MFGTGDAVAYVALVRLVAMPLVMPLAVTRASWRPGAWLLPHLEHSDLWLELKLRALQRTTAAAAEGANNVGLRVADVLIVRRRTPLLVDRLI